MSKAHKNNAKTKLMAACKSCDFNEAAHQLFLGENPNAQNYEGYTALHYAVFVPEPSMSVVQLLLAFGADLHVRNNKNETGKLLMDCCIVHHSSRLADLTGTNNQAEEAARWYGHEVLAQWLRAQQSHPQPNLLPFFTSASSLECRLSPFATHFQRSKNAFAYKSSMLRIHSLDIRTQLSMLTPLCPSSILHSNISANAMPLPHFWFDLSRTSAHAHAYAAMNMGKSPFARSNQKRQPLSIVHEISWNFSDEIVLEVRHVDKEAPRAARQQIGQQWKLNDMQLTSYVLIGRGSKSNIALTDVSVSKLHAQMGIGADQRLYVRDVGSKHGTFINGKRITSIITGGLDDDSKTTPWVPVRPRLDTVSFGRVHVTLAVSQPSTSTTAPPIVVQNTFAVNPDLIAVIEHAHTTASREKVKKRTHTWMEHSDQYDPLPLQRQMPVAPTMPAVVGDGIGKRMLENMGWKGEGLGRHEQGVSDAISLQSNTSSAGLGHQTVPASQRDDLYSSDPSRKRAAIQRLTEQRFQRAG